MLNYFLDQLAGPKCMNLKVGQPFACEAGTRCYAHDCSIQVNQPEKYGFKPRSLLKKISGVYIHLAGHSTRTQELADAVARDGRSYNDAVFSKAATILRKDALLPEVHLLHFHPASSMALTAALQDEIKKFEDFARLARESAEKANEAEENLGEIPDEFLGTLFEIHFFLSTRLTS